jgi:DNA-directed RNA polymerase subunit beta'
LQGKLEIEDLKLLRSENEGNAVDIVVSRSTELKLIDENRYSIKHT